MATAEQPSGSILHSVADHEKALLQKKEAARSEAQTIVEQSRAEARRQLQEKESELVGETATLRREAEAARLRQFEETVNSAAARLDGVREEASRRVPELAKQVLSLFVPAVTEEKS